MIGLTFRTLEKIFHRAVALPEQERETFLDEACAERSALRLQLERMIQADSKASSVIDIGASDDVSAAEPKRSVGRWKLLEPIGVGGAGIVYRATCEADGVTIQAAVKIPRRQLGVRLHQRFVQERIILAGLNHPYIARLIDVGADPPGTSFLAMEFIAGSDLDEYLEQRKPSLRDRLELFDRICQAITYLHDNGIVHGDLKPSNILVTDEGMPKLLDFGTACFLNGADARADLTGLMMTPAYASPEQLAGLGPSALGDVYSLGCILRELLEDERLCGDLSAILDKCLARPARARYSSPREIRLDVGRYLHHYPIRARATSPMYAGAKFLRRNDIACGLSGLVLLSVLTLLFVSRNSAVRAEQSAEQRRSAIARLVRDDPASRSPDAQARTAYAAGVEDSIAQMERMDTPPVTDLTSAWRRAAYSQAFRGQTPESIKSIERSIWWARQLIQRRDTAEARCQLIESLLYAAILYQRGIDAAHAGPAALEAVQLADTLPAANRTAIEKSFQFVRSLVSAGRRRAATGDIDGGRALLNRALALGRTMGKSVQLRCTLDLVRFERTVKQPGRAAALCAEARSLEVGTERLRRVCRDDAQTGGGTAREAALTHQAAVLEKRLVMDPEAYGERLHLARMQLQLARTATDKGDPDRAGDRLAQARTLTKSLLETDPENLRLRRLLRRITRSNELLIEPTLQMSPSTVRAERPPRRK